MGNRKGTRRLNIDQIKILDAMVSKIFKEGNYSDVDCLAKLNSSRQFEFPVTIGNLTGARRRLNLFKFRHKKSGGVNAGFKRCGGRHRKYGSPARHIHVSEQASKPVSFKSLFGRVEDSIAKVYEELNALKEVFSS